MRDGDREFYDIQDRHYENFKSDLNWERERSDRGRKSAMDSLHAGNLARAAADLGMYDMAVEISETQARRQYASQSEPEPDYGILGRQKLRLKEYLAAIDYFDRAIDRDSTDDNLHRDRGFCCLKLEKYEEALRDLDKAVVRNWMDGQAYYLRGWAKAELGDKEGAIEDFSTAIGLGFNHWYVYRERGLAYDYKKEYPKAVDDLSVAIKYEPTDAFLHLTCGFARYDMGDLKGAITDADNASAFGVGKIRCSAYNLRGRACYDLREYGPAIDSFNRAEQVDAQGADLFVRGMAHEAESHFEKAIADYDECIRRKPHRVAAFRRRGFCQYMLNDWSAAINDLTLAINLEPNAASAYAMRGHSYLSLNDYAAAIKDFDKAMELDPAEQVFMVRGMAHEYSNDFQKAIDDYTKALELEETAIVHLARGHCFERLKANGKAMEDCDAAIRINPRNAGALRLRGRLYAKLRKKRKVLDDFGGAIALEPASAINYLYRGDYLAAIGEKEQAINDYKKASKLYRDQGQPDRAKEAMRDWKKLAAVSSNESTERKSKPEKPKQATSKRKATVRR